MKRDAFYLRMIACSFTLGVHLHAYTSPTFGGSMLGILSTGVLVAVYIATWSWK